MVKWVCHNCSSENCIVEDEGFIFTSKLYRLSSDGWCCLCKKEIEPYPLEEWSSAIRIERGITEPSTKGEFHMFRVKESGHLHYACMDELHIELWRLIERTDTPDPTEWLSRCG